MGRARPSLLLIACGFAILFLTIFLLEADFFLLPHKPDQKADAWMIPFPIVQSDGTVQIVSPLFLKSYDNLRAVVRGDGGVKIVGDVGTKASDNLTVILEPELAANFNKYNFINLTSYDFHWLYWRTCGNLKIYNANGGKKIEMYLLSISYFHKEYYGEYEFFDNKIVLSIYNCKRFIFFRFMILYCTACLLIFIGFVLMIGDVISSLRAKKGRLTHNAC